jgi:hypothetical protein
VGQEISTIGDRWTKSCKKPIVQMDDLKYWTFVLFSLFHLRMICQYYFQNSLISEWTIDNTHHVSFPHWLIKNIVVSAFCGDLNEQPRTTKLNAHVTHTTTAKNLKQSTYISRLFNGDPNGRSATVNELTTPNWKKP